MFRIRAVLAALMSPTWGVYSGYELFEHLPVREGSEEYLDSEKYQLRPRDYEGAIREGRSLAPYLAHLNRLRQCAPGSATIAQPAFPPHRQRNLLAFSKRDDETGDTVLVVVTLDPYSPQRARRRWTCPRSASGGTTGWSCTTRCAAAATTTSGAQFNFVRLDPHVEPAHVLVVRR